MPHDTTEPLFGELGVANRAAAGGMQAKHVRSITTGCNRRRTRASYFSFG